MGHKDRSIIINVTWTLREIVQEGRKNGDRWRDARSRLRDGKENNHAALTEAEMNHAEGFLGLILALVKAGRTQNIFH